MTMFRCFLLSVLTAMLPIIAVLGQNIQVNPSFRLYPSAVTQTEVLITVHPGDPNVLFASANTINFSPFFVSEGVYASTDGGNSWFGNDTCTGSPIPFHGGDPGIAIDKDGRFILTRLGSGPFTGLYSHFSTDRGLSLSSQYTITTDLLERAAVASDGFPASNFYGRTYAVWVNLFSPYPTSIVYTDNGGASWSAPIRINNPTQQSAGGDIAIDADGRVHVCWARVQTSSPFTEISIGYASSADGGGSWSVTENAYAVRGIRGLMPEKSNIRVDGLPRIAVDNSGGPRDGWIYIVNAQSNLAPAGNDPDIILHRSTNGGASWSAGIRVNQDALNNGKIQFMPAIAVDDQGAINILYYDDRTTTSDSTGVFLSRSVDGGDTWQEYEIADHHFKPLPLGGLGQGYQGDNIDIVAVGNVLYPVWMDNYTGIYQAWSARIDLAPTGIPQSESANTPGNFLLEQNFPNPFNGSTQFPFTLRKAGHVRLEVYSLEGKRTATIVDQSLSAGTYTYQWAPRGLPSGVYLYRLSVGREQQTKKLLLLN